MTKLLRQVALAATITLGLMIANVSAAHAQLTFTLFTDTTFDATLTDATNNGTFTFATDPGDGVFTSAQAGAFSLNFNAGSETFTESDILSNPDNYQFLISTDTDGRRLQFYGSGGGPFSGSMDLVNSNGKAFSFEPGSNSGLYFATGDGARSGTYRLQAAVAPSVPEAGTLALALPMLGIIGAVAVRRKK